MKAAAPFSRYNIKAVAPIKHRLAPKWCFRRSVAKMPHAP
jgi:hypothetical protein